MLVAPPDDILEGGDTSPISLVKEEEEADSFKTGFCPESEGAVGGSEDGSTIQFEYVDPEQRADSKVP